MSAPDDDIGHLGISRRAVVAGLTAVACVQWDVAMAAPDDGTLAERFVMFDPPVPLQPISLLDRNGRSATLAARPGRTRLIVLWANWCPACHQEVPALAAAQRSLARDGIDVAVVNVDATPLTGIVIRSTDVSTGTLPSFFDSDGAGLSAPSPDGRRSPLQLFGMPILFVVDRAGLVRGYMKGPVNWTDPLVIAFFRSIDDAPSR